MQLRRATMEDMYEMQHCNLRCLPENYNLRYYHYHLLSWPQLLYVQQDYNRSTVGYVLAKLDDEESAEKKHGHITSLAVLRSHRKLGIASRVMRAAMREMDAQSGAHYCSLHVRRTNAAALHLYQDTLGFRCVDVEQKYYVDDEDAFHMKHFFHQENPGAYVNELGRLVRPGPPPVSVVPSKPGSSGNQQKQQQQQQQQQQASGGGGGKGKNKKKGGDDDKAAMTANMEQLLEELGESGSGKKGGGNKGGNNKQQGKKGKK